MAITSLSALYKVIPEFIHNRALTPPEVMWVKFCRNFVAKKSHKCRKRKVQ